MSACSLAGRLRGRPGLPRGPMIERDGIDQREQAGSHRGRWRPRGGRPAGCRCDPPRGGTWSRACRGRPGSGRSARPPFGPDAQAIHARPAPVDGGFVAQPVEQPLVQPLPDAGFLPVAQPSPAGRATAAAQLLREQPPRAAGAQDEDDAAEGGTVRRCAGDRLWAWAAPWAARVRWLPRGRRGQGMRRSWPAIMPPPRF